MDILLFEHAMNHAAEAESIRKLVLRTIFGWGASEAGVRAGRVTDILRGDASIGRRYEFDGFHAIWLRDRDVVIFSGRNGQLLKTVSASEALSGNAKVA